MIMEKESPDEERGNRDGVLSEKKISFRVDAAIKDQKEGTSNGVQVTSIQTPSSNGVQVTSIQQPSQGSGVCWERFLNVRSIRVLLVENDDSTRHVLTALLRNCNYEVINAANGLQAWKVLEDLNNQVDIVLTEVVMPCLAGVALLCKIMSHKTRKNIPVIMMSSHDSMGLVFKCLSKGAVDFLVKPIRKNELKNLWQHVWRRCHSSSGSGSESATQTQKSVKSKNSEKADNSGSDDGENNGSNGLNVADGSDDGSGTQSSWTKQAVEVDSSQTMSPIDDQVAECPDSTCAQVIRPNAENSGNRRVDNSVREGHEQSKRDAVAQGKELETNMSRNVECKSKNPMEIPVTPMGAKTKSLSGLDCIAGNKQFGESGTAKVSIALIDGKESGSTREVMSILDIKNVETDDSKEPNFELSLKRLRGVQDTGRSVQDDRCVVRRSEQSAFSRYNTSSNVFKPPNGGLTGSGSIIDNSTEHAKRESVGDIQAHSNEHIVYKSSNGVSNIDMGSTTNKQSITQQPHCHNYYHRHCHHLLNSEEKQPSYNNEKKLAVDAPQCGSPNVLSGQMESNLNRSASGSNFGSNGQINGSSTAVNAVGTNAESDFGQAGKSGSGDGSAIGTGVDENKLTHREAALNKFRQKRKERCFKKKVRYQNRKKLAEQRPRVRGQFVKQTGTDSSNRTEDE